MEWLLAKAGVQATQYAAGGAAAIALAWIFKKIPNDKIKAKFGLFMYGFGVACTLGLAKYKLTKKGEDLTGILGQMAAFSMKHFAKEVFKGGLHMY